MPWNARLQLDYRREGDRTVGHDRHSGPLRVLQRLYPEGPAICHQVIVHPPAGIVGGDVLELDATLGERSHVVLTTPGAARYYRSDGLMATQSVRLRVGPNARLEWLPQETIAYSGCRADNRLRFELAQDAEAIGWDVLALGLPASGRPYEEGCYRQHLELDGAWLERGTLAAADRRLFASPLGLAGCSVLASMWFAAASPLAGARGEALLEAGRRAAAASPLAARAGATLVSNRVVVLRVLAGRVEPAMALLRAAWAEWRRIAWSLEAPPHRLWST